jgi:hypothetical protein
MPVLTIPRGINDLTVDWLDGALSAVSDGARVVDMVAWRIGNGDISDSVRLVPVWDRPTAGPSSVVAKVPSTEESSRTAGFATRTYELEAAFYNELAGSLWVNRPHCYLAQYDRDNEAYVVIMEDLSPAEPGDQVAGCSPGDAAGVIHEMVALHAPRWGDETLLDVKWLDRPGPQALRGTLDLLPALFGGFVDRYRERIDRPVLELSVRLMESLEGYLLDRPGPWSVVHGDFRLDNLLFGGPRVVVVDWQTVKIGSPLSDLADFIGSSLLTEDRRTHEARLVADYHTSLARAGVTMGWDECWDGYRRYSFDGLIRGMAASMLATRTTRRDDVFVAMVNRHGQQALDLGSSEFLAR